MYAVGVGGMRCALSGGNGKAYNVAIHAAKGYACRIRTYGITLGRLHAFPFLPDGAWRVPLALAACMES